MPIFKTISEKQAKGKVKKIFDEIKRARKIKKIPFKNLKNLNLSINYFKKLSTST